MVPLRGIKGEFYGCNMYIYLHHISVFSCMGPLVRMQVFGVERSSPCMVKGVLGNACETALILGLMGLGFIV